MESQMFDFVDRHSMLGIILTIIQILAMIGFWICMALAIKELWSISTLENKHKKLEEPKKQKRPCEVPYCFSIFNQLFGLFRKLFTLCLRFLSDKHT
jgi:hypothetical protein